MKRVVSLCTAALAVMALLSTAAMAEPAPKIACDEPVHNFGKKESNSSVPHTFILKNVGDAPLQINNVRPACGCTVANISKRSVEPGGISEVTTKLSLKGRKGHQRKSVTVESNDPSTPRLVLYIEGEAVSNLEVSPNRLFMGQVSVGDVVEKVVDIRSFADQPISVKRVETDWPNLDVSYEAVEEGRQYQVKIATKAPLPIGRASTSVRVITDNLSQPIINIPVFINVVGALSFSPNEIVLNREMGMAVTRYLVVGPGSTKEFSIESVDVPVDTIKSKVTKLGPNGYRIQIDNLVADDALDGKSIKITTSVDDMKEIEIPLRLVNNQAPPEAP